MTYYAVAGTTPVGSQMDVGGASLKKKEKNKRVHLFVFVSARRRCIYQMIPSQINLLWAVRPLYIPSTVRRTVKNHMVGLKIELCPSVTPPALWPPFRINP